MMTETQCQTCGNPWDDHSPERVVRCEWLEQSREVRRMRRKLAAAEQKLAAMPAPSGFLTALR